MSKYFGTDGIRGKAEKFTKDFLAGIVDGLVGDEPEKKVLIGGDTRESTEWILEDLADALETFGVEHGNCGVLPTPAINLAFYEMGFDYAIDVTASHNPYGDNGIKIFTRGEKSGVKLPAEKREKIEEKLTEVENGKTYELKKSELREDLHMETLEVFLRHLKSAVGEYDFSGIKMGVDCANGATSVVGGGIFERMGAEVTEINVDAHYGQKINRDAGSTHIEGLQKIVTEKGLDCGAAFDGDGDRCLMVDENGEVVDGDQMIALLAKNLRLDAVVGTVASNQGLAVWARENGLKFAESNVGDQNVYNLMQEEGILIGGEQNGHVILPGEVMGNGILTALMVVRTMKETDKKLSELAKEMRKFPQASINVPATAEQKEKFVNSGRAKELEEELRGELDAVEGKLLVRPSGTEELIRVVVWGNDEKKIEELAEKVAERVL